MAGRVKFCLHVCRSFLQQQNFHEYPLLLAGTKSERSSSYYRKSLTALNTTDVGYCTRKSLVTPCNSFLYNGRLPGVKVFNDELICI
jgi:hypothetical protein